jgi:hypothetical protein
MRASEARASRTEDDGERLVKSVGKLVFKSSSTLLVSLVLCVFRGVALGLGFL